MICCLVGGSQHLVGRMKWHLGARDKSLVGTWDSRGELLPPSLTCLTPDKSSSAESPPGQVAPGLDSSASLRWQSPDHRIGGITKSLCRVLPLC